MTTDELEARARVDAVCMAVDRLAVDDLAGTPVPPRDPEERTALIAGLQRAADEAGRGTLLGDARAAVRQALATRAASRSRDERGEVAPITTGRPEDVAGLVLALEDAVAVAATQDLLDPGDAAVLADPGRRLLGLDPLPGSTPEPGTPASGWTPSAEDWAASDEGGVAEVDHDEPMAGNRALQSRFFELVGAAGAMVALGIGLVAGQPLLGALGALAIVLLAWTFARYRRPINRP